MWIKNIIGSFIVCLPGIAVASAPYAIVRCRQHSSGGVQSSTQFFFLESTNDDSVTVTPDGVISIKGRRAVFYEHADPASSSCPFGFREMMRVCKPLRMPACQVEPVFKTSSTNVVTLIPSAGTTWQTCAAGSSVEAFDDVKDWLDAVHAVKFSAPRVIVTGTRLDPLKRECLLK